MPLALFDLDNTLVDRAGAFRRWASGWVREVGLGDEAADWLVEHDGDGATPIPELFTSARRQFGLATPVHAMVADYRRAVAALYAPDPAVLGALRRLRAAGWSVAVVTNGPPAQRAKVTSAGLAPLLDACCVSDELGVAKPDPSIFAEAARRAGVERAEVVVGDHPEADIGGGRRAGLTTIWLARGRTWTHPGYRPDAVVQTVGEAVEVVLARWPAPRGRAPDGPR